MVKGAIAESRYELHTWHSCTFRIPPSTAKMPVA